MIKKTKDRAIVVRDKGRGGGMKSIVSLMLIAALLGLSFSCTPYHAQGAGTGAAVGGVTGAILDSRNP